MILIVDKIKSERDTVAEMFHYMGILSYPISDEGAPYEISSLYSAVLLTSTQGIADTESYVSSLREIYGIPVFLTSDEGDDAFDGVFPRNSYSSGVAEGINELLHSRGLCGIGEYELGGIDASFDNLGVSYLGSPIEFTKTERMILKLLIRAYPTYMSAEKILKYAFKLTRCPEPSSVRTHISAMNRKFKAKFGIPLIVSSPGEGYVIATNARVREREAALL